jgi:peptidoglycan/xylan/chitin deacetylase (PgdA/CDA1 family)
MSMLKSWLVGGVAALVPIERMVGRHSVTVLMYHELGSDEARHNAWTVVRRADFLRQVAVLRRHFDLVSMDEAARGLREGWSGERPRAVLTFDDGHVGLHEHLLPAVEREQVPVTVYIATGHIETGHSYWFDRVVNAVQVRVRSELDLRDLGLGRYAFDGGDSARSWLPVQALLVDLKGRPAGETEELVGRIEARLASQGRAAQGAVLRPMTIAQVQELARCPQVTIGAHSHGHELLTEIPREQARASILRSRELLQQWIDRPVAHFAYPSGYYNEALERLVEELGFATGMGSWAGFWVSQRSPYDIPRVGVGRFDSDAQFRVNLMGGLRGVVAGLGGEDRAARGFALAAGAAPGRSLPGGSSQGTPVPGASR